MSQTNSLSPTVARRMTGLRMNHGTKKYVGVSLLVPISTFVVYLGSLSPTLDLSMTPRGDEKHLQVNFINAHELREWLEKGQPFDLVDARWPEEYAHGHIPTAVSLHRLGVSNPGYQSSKGSAKESDRQVPLVFYCNAPAMTKSDPCVRAIVRELQRDSSQVYWFKAGMRTWQDNGYPVVGGSKNGSYVDVLFGR